MTAEDVDVGRLVAELAEARQHHAAIQDVFEIINATAGENDLTPVFDAMLDKAMRLSAASFGVLAIYDGARFATVATRGVPAAFAEFRRRRPPDYGPGTGPARLAAGERVVHIPDMKEEEPYRRGDPNRRAIVDLGGARTSLLVALTKEDSLRGFINIYRKDPQPFGDKQIALLQSFAAQAVIAMENARLLTETRAARNAAESMLLDLKAAQANLIQAEKMASLGQLTAGIAHEIKNPLNFVNNFASLSNELLAELKDSVAPALAGLGGPERAELDDTLELLSDNLSKITEHGKRADNIVKSMLAHSRGAGGDRQAVDLNALVEDSLNLAYHGARAQDPLFNATLERDFDQTAKPIALVPQDITRVFLNLFGNGFYAVMKRAKAEGGSFRPVVRVVTRDRGGAIEIAVRDNGIGIPVAIRDKLFEPFFTTKPTGEGTGLGLSISYDIVIKQHGGAIIVDSEEGTFTEFTIRLPRGKRAGG